MKQHEEVDYMELKDAVWNKWWNNVYRTFDDPFERGKWLDYYRVQLQKMTIEELQAELEKQS